MRQKHLNQQITPASMDEIRDLRMRDLDAEVLWRRKKEMTLQDAEALSRWEVVMRFRESDELRAKLKEARERSGSPQVPAWFIYKIKPTNYNVAWPFIGRRLIDSGRKDHESLKRFLELSDEAASITREIAQTQGEMAVIEKEFAMAQDMFGRLQRITKERFERETRTKPRAAETLLSTPAFGVAQVVHSSVSRCPVYVCAGSIHAAALFSVVRKWSDTQKSQRNMSEQL